MVVRLSSVCFACLPWPQTMNFGKKRTQARASKQIHPENRKKKPFGPSYSMSLTFVVDILLMLEIKFCSTKQSVYHAYRKILSVYYVLLLIQEQ